MASVYDLANTEASSSATAGWNTAEGQDPSTVNDGLRRAKEILAAFVDDLGGVNTVGGSADALTVALAQVAGGNSISAYATGQLFRFASLSTNTTSVTINVNSIGAKHIRKISGGTDVALIAGDIAAGRVNEVIYSAAANAAAGAFILNNPALAIPVTGPNGGTGTSAYAVGDLLYANTTTSFAKLAISTAGLSLRVNAGATAPEWAAGVTSGTRSTTTGGTEIAFTSVPSWVKKITVTVVGLSFNGTADILVQLGDSGGYESTGYTCLTAAVSSTAGFNFGSGNAANVFHGKITLEFDGTTWVAAIELMSTNGPNTHQGAGSKALSGTLDRIRITPANGTDTVDANGGVNILYEG